MKKIIILLLCLPTLLLADIFEDNDLKVLNKKNENQVVVEDENKHKYQINYYDELTSDHLEKIVELKKEIFKMKYIKVKRIFFTVEDNVVSAVVIPSSYIYKGENVGPFIPGGVSFFLENDVLNYDFRVVREDYSFKLKGKYKDEQKLFIEINKTRKQKILVQKREKIEKEIIKRVKEGKPIDSAFYAKMAGIDNINTQKKKDETKPSDISHSLRLYVGSGGLASLAYGFKYKSLEILPSVGYSVYKNEDSDDPLTSVPLGLRTSFYLLNLGSFKPYLFAGGFYSIAVKNTENLFLGAAGAGVVVVEYGIAEAGYFMSGEGSSFVIGLGARIPF